MLCRRMTDLSICLASEPLSSLLFPCGSLESKKKATQGLKVAGMKVKYKIMYQGVTRDLKFKTCAFDIKTKQA